MLLFLLTMLWNRLMLYSMYWYWSSDFTEAFSFKMLWNNFPAVAVFSQSYLINFVWNIIGFANICCRVLRVMDSCSFRAMLNPLLFLVGGTSGYVSDQIFPNFQERFFIFHYFWRELKEISSFVKIKTFLSQCLFTYIVFVFFCVCV